jgi:hypothetical protein
MTERILRFGPNGSLTGILTLPDRASPERPFADTAIVFLNAGAVHRIGPWRMHVDLARAFAAGGRAGFRFDLSGLGDSICRTGAGVLEERWKEDLLAALDAVEAGTGIRRFVLFGVCSGAYLGWHGGLWDRRIAGLTLLDGFGFRTLSWYFDRYVRRPLSPRRWRNLLRRLTRPEAGERLEAPPIQDDSGFFDRFPAPDQQRRRMAELHQAGLKVFLFYSGGVGDYFAHQNQFREMFGSVPGFTAIDRHYRPESDHTLWLAEDRAWLRDAIANWLDRHFPIGVSAPAGPGEPSPPRSASDLPQPAASGSDDSRPREPVTSPV